MTAFNAQNGTEPVRLPIRAAVDDDVSAMIRLRAEAEEWLARNGIRQWTDDYYDYARDVLRAAVAAGNAHVVDDVIDGQQTVVATLSLIPADPDFWGWLPTPERADAVYLSKMIVARSYVGRGLGPALLNWAGGQAVRAGKSWIRLDCRRDNTRLQAYYESLGFKHVRTWHAPSRRTESGWLGQRPASVRTDTDVTLEQIDRRA